VTSNGSIDRGNETYGISELLP